MTAIFDAMDITGLVVLVTAGIVGFIGVDLLFMSGRFVKRIIKRG